MAEAKKAAKAAETQWQGPTVRAAESHDPAVQHLLAERQTAVLNGDIDGAAAIDERITALGYLL